MGRLIYYILLHSMLMSWWSHHKIRKKPSIRKRYQGLKKTLIRVILGFFVFLLCSIWFRFARNEFFYNPADILQEVEFDDDSMAFVSTGTWYKELEAWILWQYRKPFSLWDRGDLEQSITKKYDIIQSIDIAIQDQLANVYIVYAQPYISIRSNNDLHRVAQNNFIWEVAKSDIVLDNTIELYLPEYIQPETTDDIQWIFFSTHSNTLKEIIGKILDILFIDDITKFTFIPGGEKLIIEYLNKTLIFHLDKSIDAQLAKIVDISNFFADYGSIQRIDLWSSDDIIVK